jgi:DNA recombination protein RmuC
MQYFIGFIIGLVLGLGLFYLVSRLQRKESAGAFAALSREALQKNSQDFLTLAGQHLAGQEQKAASELETKKQLIDQTLQSIKSDLGKVEKLVSEAETARVKSTSEISTALKTAALQTEKLQETTGKLQAALANTKIRDSGENAWLRMCCVLWVSQRASIIINKRPRKPFQPVRTMFSSCRKT